MNQAETSAGVSAGVSAAVSAEVDAESRLQAFPNGAPRIAFIRVSGNNQNPHGERREFHPSFW